MLFYCLRSRENTESKNAKVVKTKNGRIMHSLKCSVCGSIKSRYTKEQDAKGLLCMIGKISLLGPLLIWIKIAFMDTLKNNHL